MQIRSYRLSVGCDKNQKRIVHTITHKLVAGENGSKHGRGGEQVHKATNTCTPIVGTQCTDAKCWTIDDKCQERNRVSNKLHITNYRRARASNFNFISSQTSGTRRDSEANEYADAESDESDWSDFQESDYDRGGGKEGGGGKGGEEEKKVSKPIAAARRHQHSGIPKGTKKMCVLKKLKSWGLSQKRKNGSHKVQKEKSWKPT